MPRLSRLVSRMHEPMSTEKSRRQFIRWTFFTLAAACGACRDRNQRNGPSVDATQPQGTNAAARWPDNVVGRFCVTQVCIDCDLCKETAPLNFARNEKEGHAYVRKQPTGHSELGACLEALEGCPVEAIIDTHEPSRTEHAPGRP
jgi:ferredoxin